MSESIKRNTRENIDEELAQPTEGAMVAELGHEGLTDEEVLEALNRAEGPELAGIFSPKQQGGKRLAKGERASAGEWLKKRREEMGYVGKRVLRAAGPKSNANGPEAETATDEDEAALEEAFREVTLDEVLAEEQPEQKTAVERLAERLGRAKMAEIILGAINEAREQAGNYYDYLRTQAEANEVDYDELLQLVRERVKSGYDDRKEKIKFYYSLSGEEFKKAVEAGKLERAEEPEGAERGVTNLRFSQDLVGEDGTVWTGFGEERGAESEEVTLVFGGDLIDEESFDALLPEAVGVDMVDLQEKCLAVVSDQPGLRGLLAKNNLAIPVYWVGEGEESWQRKARSVEELAERKADAVEKLMWEETLRREVLTEVDTVAAQERMQKLAEKFQAEDWDKSFEDFQRCKTDEEYEAAERQVFGRVLEVLGVKGAAEVRYIDDAKDTRMSYLTMARDAEGYQAWIMTENRHWVESGAMTKSIESIAHEGLHAWQMTQVQHQGSMAEQYGYNFANYIPPEVDRAGYRGQLIEVEARAFEEACAERFYQRYEETHKTPLAKAVEALQGWLKKEKGQRAEGEE